MVQTEGRTRRQRIEQAVAHALDRDWDLAVEENRALLKDDPDDVEAANRLGKALTELDDVAGAIEAYERARAVDPTNAIARKNLARLGELKPTSSQPAREARRRRRAPRSARGRAATRETCASTRSSRSPASQRSSRFDSPTSRRSSGSPWATLCPWSALSMAWC